MLRFLRNSFFLEKMGTSVVLWLHLAAFYLKLLGLIFLILFVFLILVVKNDIVFEVVFILEEQRMFDYAGKSHSFFAVYHENSFEKILKF